MRKSFADYAFSEDGERIRLDTLVGEKKIAHYFRSYWPNKELQKGANIRWRISHPNYKGPSNTTEWRENNPDKYREWKHNRRGWGWEPLNEFFKGGHGHHLHINNHSESIYIPDELHKSIPHRYNNPESMQEINDAALEWYNTQVNLMRL